MKKIALFLALAFTALAGLAQPPAGANRGNGQQMTGRFYGKIVESVSGKGIEAASVQLVGTKMDSATKKRVETVITGMLTKANGDFSLENVPLFGQYTLKVSAIGVKPLEQKIGFELKMGGGDPSAMMSAIDKDLGNIKMELDAQVLGQVTVTASKPGLQLGIDRKVFNVDKNIVSAGGTAVDVMRNVPSLNVDIDGNVTMRNNAPQIFVDGRPSNLTLEQIPADAIASVELITNPSAKFDASGGTSGILNIVLKKEKKVGYNGSVRANIDSRAKVGIGGDINLRQQKLNLFLNTMVNQRKSISNGITERTNLYQNPDTYMIQRDRSVHEGMFGFLRGGFDYFISNRNTLSLSANYGRGQFKPNTISDIFTDTLYSPVKTSSFNERTSNMEGNFRNLGTTLSFKHNFPKPGRELTADVTYNRSKNNNTTTINTDYYTVPQNQLVNNYRQLQEIEGQNQNMVFQTDFVNPINDKSKLELGLRGQIRRNESENAFFVADQSGHWVLQQSSQISYESDDRVYAAYGNYSNRINKFGYQLGLRAESSDYEGRLTRTGEVFKIDFPVSLFPSVFLSQQINETQSLQLNYSRRINRPGFWNLIPFTDSTDRLNPRKGNPALTPEFTNSFELSYEKTFKNKGNFLASVYYKHTNDLITSILIPETGAGGEEVILSTFVNANSSYVSGLELTSRNNLAKWWEFTPNLNIYMSDVNLGNGQADPERMTSFFVKVNNTFKLPKNFTIQLSGDYQAKTLLPPGGSGGGRGGGGGMMFGGGSSASQGYIRPNYGVDIAIRFEFLKNKTASLSLNMNDIFRTRAYDVHSESPLFIQDMFRRRDPQVLRLNFNWRFGKFDPSLFKRKNTKAEREGMNMEGMQ